MINKIFSITLFVLTLAVLTASDEAGGTAGSYLRMPVDARSAAVGNAGTAVIDDVNMSHGNPAALPSMKSKQFSTSFQFLSLDRSYQTLSFGVGLPPNAGMSVSWVHAGVDGIGGRNYSNDYTYEYSWSQNAFIIGFGLQIADWLSLGVSGKVLSDQLVNSSSSGFSADIGVLINPVKGLQLGFVAKDVSGKITWDTSSEPYAVFQTRRVDNYPRVYHMGASYHLLDRYLFSVSYKYSEDIEPTWHAGFETLIAEMFYLRAGLDNGSPAFGMGTAYKIWDNISTRMDYAFVTARVNEGGSHLFSWLFYF